MKRNILIKLSAIVLVVIIISSCGENWLNKNDDDPIIPEVNKDNLSEFINIKVGMLADDCYDSIQKLKDMDSIAYLFVVANIFYTAEDLDSVIELYNDLYIDSKTGTSNGVQINYKSDTIKSIYLNSGVQLPYWPYIEDTEQNISIGDSVNTIYDKIIELEDEYIYSEIIYRTWNKNLEKDYDSNMGNLDLWYCTRKIGEVVQEIDLYYGSGVLDSIVRYEFKTIED